MHHRYFCIFQLAMLVEKIGCIADASFFFQLAMLVEKIELL